MSTATTQPMHRTITQEQADDIVNLLGYDNQVEDSETFEAEYRYFLLHSENVLIIGFDGAAKVVDFDGQLLSREHFVDFEEVSATSVRYWNAKRNCGVYQF